MGVLWYRLPEDGAAQEQALSVNLSLPQMVTNTNSNYCSAY